MAKTPVTPLSGANSQLADFLVELALDDDLRQSFKTDRQGTVEKAQLSKKATKALLTGDNAIVKQAIKRVLAFNNQIQETGGGFRRLRAASGAKRAKANAKKAAKKR